MLKSCPVKYENAISRAKETIKSNAEILKAENRNLKPNAES